MNRLEKKCFITVASAHGLMVVILFVGPAFFVSSQKSADFKPITVFSAADVTMAMSSGQRVESAPANPLPPPPPATEPPKEAQKPIDVPPPPKNNLKPPVKDLDVEKPTKPTLHGDDPVIKPTKQHVVQIDNSELTPNKNNDAEKLRAERKAEAERRARAQAAAEARQRAELAKEFGDGVTSLNRDLSGKTPLTIHPGGGESGPAAVNYFQLVQSTLENAWHPSETLGDDTPTATISIVISRDGTLRGHISKRSGNGLMDKSVQNVLDTVTSVQPFPADLTAQQLPATFTFNIKAKR